MYFCCLWNYRVIKLQRVSCKIEVRHQPTATADSQWEIDRRLRFVCKSDGFMFLQGVIVLEWWHHSSFKAAITLQQATKFSLILSNKTWSLTLKEISLLIHKSCEPLLGLNEQGFLLPIVRVRHQWEVCQYLQSHDDSNSLSITKAKVLKKWKNYSSVTDVSSYW